MKNVKIAYVNGYKGENSDKPKTLEKILDTKIDHFVWKYGEHSTYDFSGYDLVIASSTGALIAREFCDIYNVPLISLNPVIDPVETFAALGVDPPKVKSSGRLTEMIIATEDDELIPFEKTRAFALDNNIWLKSFPTGGHRFLDLERIKPAVDSFLALILAA